MVRPKAGEAVYIVAGALQLDMNSGKLKGVLSIDPWLHQLPGLSQGVDELRKVRESAFPVETICQKPPIPFCSPESVAASLLKDPRVEQGHLSHMAVADDGRAVGILNLDRVRAEFVSGRRGEAVKVGDIYDELSDKNKISADTSIAEYLSTVEAQPFRLVVLDNGQAGILNVEHLQKLPVRAFLFMELIELEQRLTTLVLKDDPKLSEMAQYRKGTDTSKDLWTGDGPVRRIDQWKFGRILKEVNSKCQFGLDPTEVESINRFRNRIMHGPQWYMTRRRDIRGLASMVVRIDKLITIAANCE